MTKTKNKVNLPHKVTVGDYHDIEQLNDDLRGSGLKVKEVGFGGYYYVGIVYVGSLRDPQNQAMIRKLKIECKENEESDE